MWRGVSLMNCVKQKAIAKKLISFMLVICLIGMPEIKGYAQEGGPGVHFSAFRHFDGSIHRDGDI